MALLTVSGEFASRFEEAARLAAQALGWEFINETRLSRMIEEEFGSLEKLPPKAWPPAAASLLVRTLAQHHIVLGVSGAELLWRKVPDCVRVHIIALPAHRVGSLMLDRRMERPQAKELLAAMDRETKMKRRQRFGRSLTRPEDFDLTINGDAFDPGQTAAMLHNAVQVKGLNHADLLTPHGEAELQFEIRLHLARHGIVPTGLATYKRAQFGHPSEEIFANLLDFYRIAWEYEPRSFPLQWDRDGKVLEAFTPDFYLPEFDVYIELTTMKQAHVTKKNRKIKLLKTIYPHINIQVFYQKDFQNLIFKYGLVDRPVIV